MAAGPAAARGDLNPPSPRGAHLEMVGAVLAGDGLARIAEITTEYVGAPVAVVVPRLGPLASRDARLERYVAERLEGAAPDCPLDVVAEEPIASAGRQLGAVLMLGPGRPDAGEYLHMAAMAAITEVAVAEARDETEQSLRGSLLEELLRRDDLDPADVVRRAGRMGCDLSEGAVGLCADPGERSAGRLIAVVADERPDALVQAIGTRVYALLPGSLDDARRVAQRLGRQALVGISSRYADPAEVRRALEEAELVLDVTADGHAPEEDIGGGTYR
ncbi:MAG TPA: hypothetical protein VF715_05155, partial [Thermoleophilaceae bacterium]